MTKDKATAFIEAQYDLAYPDGIEHHYWYIARSRIIYKEIQKAGIAEAKFLEIGCGKGTVIKALRQHQLDITGVELADISPEAALQPYISWNTDALDMAADFCASVEVIMLLDVIEHLENPLAFLESIKAHFPNARHFIITVPARPELWSNYDEFYGHFKRYTPEDLLTLSSKLQFQPVLSRYFFHSLYLPGRLVMRFKKERNLRFTAPKGLSKWIHKLLAFCFYWDYKILPGKLYGTSVIGLFKTP